MRWRRAILTQPRCSSGTTGTSIPPRRRDLRSFPFKDFPPASSVSCSSISALMRITATPIPRGRRWARCSTSMPSNTLASKRPRNCNLSLRLSGSMCIKAGWKSPPAFHTSPSPCCFLHGNSLCQFNGWSGRAVAFQGKNSSSAKQRERLVRANRTPIVNFSGPRRTISMRASSSMRSSETNRSSNAGLRPLVLHTSN